MDLLELIVNIVILYILFRIGDFFYRRPSVGDLGSRYYFITGCDTGFGYEIAKRLDGKGCHVFAGCLTEAGETELKKRCSDRLKTVSMDVSKPESVRKAFEEVKAALPAHKGLDGIHNNAGITGRYGPVEWLSLDDYKQLFGVNLYGVIDVTQVFLPLVKKAHGRVVATASVLGRVSLEMSAPYCISKFGVEAFMDSLRRQMRIFGVSVHTIEPGFHRTNILNQDAMVKTLKSTYEKAPEDAKKEYGEQYIEECIKTFLTGAINKVASSNIEEVVDAYDHALTGMFPKTRYMVGIDATVLWYPISLLPDWLTDWVFEMGSRQEGPTPVPAALANKLKV